MKFVAENSASDIEAHHARVRVEHAVQELAANFLRIVRGAGKPYELVRNVSAFIHAVVAYDEAKPRDPLSDVLYASLQVGRDRVSVEEFGEAEWLRAHGEDSIVRGALQIAASRLLEQRTQEAAGREEMHRGIRDIEQAREMAIAARREAERGQRRPSRALAPPGPVRGPRRARGRLADAG